MKIDAPRAARIAIEEKPGSPFLVRIQPLIRRDLLHRGQLDHMHRRRVAALLAGSAFGAASSFHIGVAAGEN
jgi:hypothetical protein